MANTDESTRQVLGAPDQLETRLGTLGFVDGVPNRETVETVYDHLDFVQALNVYLNAYAGASTYALRRRSASRALGASPFPTPAATENADGSTTVTFGLDRPDDVPEGNWIQTTEGRGWFPILRLYCPLVSFFDKSWRPSEIERP